MCLLVKGLYDIHIVSEPVVWSKIAKFELAICVFVNFGVKRVNCSFGLLSTIAVWSPRRDMKRKTLSRAHEIASRGNEILRSAHEKKSVLHNPI